MAKKSAKSKGYRKTPQKKPFLTKKEIKYSCIVLGVILIGVLLYTLLYDDGFISSRQIQDGDIVARAASGVNDRFLKLAEANEIDGYTMTKNAAATGQATYSFSPENEDSGLDFFFVSTSNKEAETLAKDVTTDTTELLSGNESLEFYDMVETQVQGYDAYLIAYSYDYYAADTAAEEEAAADLPSNTYCQNLTLYVHFDDTHTLALHVYLKDDNGSCYLPEAEVLDYVLSLTDCFTMLEKK